LIVVVFNAVPDGLDDEPAAGVLLVLVADEPAVLAELPHAATASTAAARPATLIIFRMCRFS
jgi:hypothetical protein